MLGLEGKNMSFTPPLQNLIPFNKENHMIDFKPMLFIA